MGLFDRLRIDQRDFEESLPSLPDRIHETARSFEESGLATGRQEALFLAASAESPGGLTFSREYAAQPSARTTGGGATFGVDGETYESYGSMYAGGYDQNPILSGRNRFWLFNEMRRTDPMIKSLLWMFNLPIRAATWAFEPHSEDGEDQLIADACSWQFGTGKEEGRLDLSWSQSTDQALLELAYGSMFEELIWGDVEWWTGADKTSRPIKPLNRLAPRVPQSIVEIMDDPDTGLIVKIVQDLSGARPIPGEKLAWYVIEKEGRNWFGQSLIRPAYGPWKLKKALMISSGIAWDRFGAGVPKIRYPEGGGVVAEQKAERMGQNIRVHERAWVALEGPPPPAGGWDVDIMNMGNMADPVNLLRHYDGMIAQAGLQMFARLGTTETGSRAVGDVLGEPFYMAAEAIAGDIAMARQKLAVRRFVDVNFGTDRPTPKLNVSKIQSKNIDKLSAAVANLAGAGLSFSDVDTQNNIRDAMELPQLPDDLAAVIDELPDDVGLEQHTGPNGEVAVDATTPTPPAGT